MTPSFFDLTGQSPLQVPEVVVLNTREKIMPLLQQINKVPGISWNDTDVIELVLQYITYEDIAIDRLHNKCLQIVAQATGAASDKIATPQGWRQVAVTPATYLQRLQHSNAPTTADEVPWLSESNQIANALFELGSYLFVTLRSLGMYTNGYLYYHFMSWLGHDLVLKRFEVTDLPQRA